MPLPTYLGGLDNVEMHLRAVGRRYANRSKLQLRLMIITDYNLQLQIGLYYI